MRHVDNNLLRAKEDDIKNIFDKFNPFHMNLKFTMDCLKTKMCILGYNHR